MWKVLAITSVVVVVSAVCFGLACGLYLLWHSVVPEPTAVAELPEDHGDTSAIQEMFTKLEGREVCPWCGYPKPWNSFEFWYFRDEGLKLREAGKDTKSSVAKAVREHPEYMPLLKKYLSDGMLSYFEASDIQRRAHNAEWDAAEEKADKELFDFAGVDRPECRPVSVIPYRLDDSGKPVGASGNGNQLKRPIPGRR